MPIWKTYTLTAGEVVNETLPNNRLFSTYGSASWFTPVLNPLLSSLIGYTVTAPSIGTYSVTFTELSGGEVITWEVVVNVVADAYNVYSNCCFNQSNIAWLNREGGWQNYIFTGIKTYEVEIGDSNTFVTEQLVKKFNEIKGVYDGKIVTTGDVPKSHIDILDSLKYSIQAFEYNPDSQAWDIPILIDKKSFTKYGSRDKFFETRLRFIYATEKLVQTQ